MLRFESNNLYQTRSKIKLLLQNFRVLGALPPDPQWFLAVWGSIPIPKSTGLPLQIFGFATG